MEVEGETDDSDEDYVEEEESKVRDFIYILGIFQNIKLTLTYPYIVKQKI